MNKVKPGSIYLQVSLSLLVLLLVGFWATGDLREDWPWAVRLLTGSACGLLVHPIALAFQSVCAPKGQGPGSV